MGWIVLSSGVWHKRRVNVSKAFPSFPPKYWHMMALDLRSVVDI